MKLTATITFEVDRRLVAKMEKLQEKSRWNDNELKEWMDTSHKIMDIIMGGLEESKECEHVGTVIEDTCIRNYKFEKENGELLFEM